MVGSHHIETSAQSERFANEGWFQQGVFQGEAHLCRWKSVLNGTFDVSECFFEGVKIAFVQRKVQAGIIQQVLHEMFVERFFVELVDGFIVVEVNWRVDQIVHKPIGCVSEHDRDGCLFGGNHVQKIAFSRVPVRFHAGRKCADINQIVGVNDDHFSRPLLVVLKFNAQNVDRHSWRKYAQRSRKMRHVDQ